MTINNETVKKSLKEKVFDLFRKKGKLFLLILVLAGVFVAGYLAFNQLGEENGQDSLADGGTDYGTWNYSECNYNGTDCSPTITSVDPSVGPYTGGTSVTITGDFFTPSTVIKFDGITATNIAYISRTSMTCTTPAHAIGAVDVSATNEFNLTGTKTDGYTYINDINTDGLWLYYDANNPASYPGTGQDVFDLSGNDVDGTLGADGNASADDPSFLGDGTQGNEKRFNFDGAADFINTTLASNFSNDISIEVWSRRTVNDNTEGRLVSTKGSTSSERLFLGVKDGDYQAGTVNGAATYADSNFIPNLEWQHSTLTYDNATGEAKVYVNGVLHNTITNTAEAASTDNINIGRIIGGGSYFAGDIAVVRVYNDVLTPTEINTNLDEERSGFGLDDANMTLQDTYNLTFTSVTTSNTTVNRDATMTNISFVDRRNAFNSWSASMSITDMVDAGTGQTIPKANLSVTPGSINIDTGSGLYTTNGAVNQNLGSTATLITNTSANGGGEFLLSPIISISVPAYTAAGTYETTITISIIT